MATKTVILLDHREGLLAKTDQTVTIDELSADKSKWTVIMEAAVEYTRILLDVCSALHPVMVIAADQSLTFLNKWQCQEGMCKIVETLARIGPPKVTEETQPDLTTALQQCVDMGLSNSLLDIQKLLLGEEPARHARVICFTSIDNPAHCVDIVNEYLDSNSNEGKTELVVFNLVENKESTELCDPHHVIHNVKPGNLFQRVLDTVIKYHNLTITTITSIPMKEEQSTNTQATAYNVNIVHPVVELPSCPRERLTMKWSSPKNAQNINLKNCVATYPVTPLDVAERPTICLVNFLLVGKQVVLEYPKPNLSVVLINHGGTIVMHYIANSVRSVFDELTPIVDTPGGKVTDYRGEELQLNIKNLELCPHPPPDAVECELPLHRSLLELERFSACFPLTYSTSPLDSCGISRIFGHSL
ncbi:protein asunder-like [Bolinopsis microptera]|uniref:protein asunder-like n=1 Tax=Bolinopsis microptera TaxID=2820187 RepID=UPI003079D965